MDAKELTANRLALARNDMRDAGKYLEAYKELEILQQQKGASEFYYQCEAIFIAAIVTYCRPFKHSRSKDNADPKLDRDSLSVFHDSPELLALHKRLEERRDKVIAHGDWEYHNTELIGDAGKTGVLRRAAIPPITHGIDVAAFLELTDILAKECTQKLYDLDRQTLDERQRQVAGNLDTNSV
jgi:hypothetical protein